MKHVDVLIVGAGISGITAASILAREKNKRVLVVEKRNHIGGNCFDCFDENGILIHRYGPHIFHTQHKDVWNYLSQFTKWLHYRHLVKVSVNGRLFSFPINLNTLEQIFKRPFTKKKMESYLDKERINFPKIKNAEQMILSNMGKPIFDLFFKNYTKKQWGVDAKDLSPEITARIPIRFDRNDYFFTDRFQGIPKEGYTAMFNKMLSHDNIHVSTQTAFNEIRANIKYDLLIYTGPIDEFYNFKYGHLPYRGIHFKFKTIKKEFYQPVAVVNYPNENKYTRVTEFKRLTGQLHKKTTICHEYPDQYSTKALDGLVPSYPILNKRSKKQYRLYSNSKKNKRSLIFLGRLAQFSYMNMDICVKRVLERLS